MALQQHPAFKRAFASPEEITTVMLASGIESSTAKQLADMTEKATTNLNHGDVQKWLDAIASLPVLTAAGSTVSYDINQDTITVELDQLSAAQTASRKVSDTQSADIKDALLTLRPWRKGPYQVSGTFIDTEWRSDWKWQRVAPHISSLAGRKVLDVGCGNGYHAWRMRGAGAALVIGIDPSPLFMLQFSALQNFINDSQVQLLPVALEALPHRLQIFDSVFSMGVLYHRRQHHEHLRELHDTLRDGGELILETLILPGAGSDMLQPAQSISPAERATTTKQDSEQADKVNGRYARMHNVWSLPTESLLHSWLSDSGFSNIRTVDINKTTVDEQRSTDWMPFESLDKALHPSDPQLTVEGWPAPTRAIVIANKPAK